METTLEQLEPTKVKLGVEVEPERVKQALETAAKHLAEGVTIPGFRKGKAPRKVLEARVGKQAITQHAMEDALSTYFAEAVQERELQPVAPPDVDVDHFDEEEGCAFEATIEVRPEVDLPDHEGISVSFPEWDVTESDVNEQLDDMRDRFAEVEIVDRPARIGDYVTMDLRVSREGEPIEDAAVDDAMYEVGSAGVTPKLDEELAGAVGGQELVYVDTMPDDYPEHGGEKAEFTVAVKDVRNKLLPDLDDDFARTASEFDTLEELRTSISDTLRRQRLENARQMLRARVLEAYLARVEVPLPEAMVTGERDNRIDQMEAQAEQYGMELDELLELQDMSSEEFREDADEQAREAVKAQIVLEALAEQVGIEIEPDELEDEIRRHAARHDVSAQEIAQVIDEQNSTGVLVGDVIRRKTLDLLVEAADIEEAPSAEQLAELGLAPLGDTAHTAAGEDAGEGTEPHPPDLGGQAPTDDVSSAVEGSGDEPAATAAADEIVSDDASVGASSEAGPQG